MYSEYKNKSRKELSLILAGLKVAAASRYGKFGVSTRCVLGFPVVMTDYNRDTYNRIFTIRELLKRRRRDEPNGLDKGREAGA